jgi:NitT/TauT family transport system ATP-binding protein
MHIEVDHLSHTYDGKPPRCALEDLSFEIATGQFIAVIGPSGCGKSTLLRLTANLLQPTRGRIRLDGVSPAQAVSSGWIAWMAQSPALLPWRSALENVQLAERFHRQNGGVRLGAREALQRVGLEDAVHVYPNMLSGGMQQRLALARTLVMDASLWLMDEPFASLDELTREHLTVELLDLWQPLHPTVLWVTHNLQEALRLADRILVLSAAPGSLAADRYVDLPRPRDEYSLDFLDLLAELRSTLGKSFVKALR